MTESKSPIGNEKSKIGDNPQNTGTKHGGLTHKELEHQYKLALMRDCKIYGKSYEETKSYFQSKGYTLSTSQFANLRNELKSAKMSTKWFDKEALYAMEDDHQLSIERIRKYENKLVQLSNDLIEDNDFKTTVDFTTDKSGNAKLRVRNYNIELYIKIINEFKSIQDTKTRMFSSTPLVQELLEVHRRQEEEQHTPIPTKHGDKKVVPILTTS